MRKKIVYVIVCLLFPLASVAQTPGATGIEWFGDNEIANNHVSHGITHLMNIELAKAYAFLEAAVDEDPSLFAPHVVLSLLTTGEKAAYHAEQAKQNVADKGEVSKLYVSLLDVPRGSEGAEARRAIWEQMYQAAPPEANLVHFYYALTREDGKDTIAALETLLAEPNPNNRSLAHVHNILGYAYYAEGDKEQAKQHFDAYLAMYPNGYNAHDSMGEYYLFEGDLEQAKAHYEHARELFPMSQNANAKLEELESRMSDQGELVLVEEEMVPPEHYDDYVQWSKEYKASADAAGTDDFYVFERNGNFLWAAAVGKTLSDLEAFLEKRRTFRQDPAVGAQYTKYKHSISSIKQSLWRHNPAQSYNPNPPTPPETTPYVRTIYGYVKFGHGGAVAELLSDIKKAWEAAGIAQPHNVYWNVMGEDEPVVVIRTEHESAEAWATNKEVEEKIGDKMGECLSRWRALMRRTETQTSRYVPALSHVNPEALTSN